jgi:hypothetical protein
VPVGTGYHWFIEAHQFVRKLDANTYETFMEGLKHKVAHQRAGWEDWSDQRSGPRETKVMVRILEESLASLKGEAAEGEVESVPAKGKRAKAGVKRRHVAREAAPAELEA